MEKDAWTAIAMGLAVMALVALAFRVPLLLRLFGLRPPIAAALRISEKTNGMIARGVALTFGLMGAVMVLIGLSWL